MHAFLHAVAPRLCERHGLRWLSSATSPHLVRVEFPDGTVRHVVSNRLDLNPSAAADMARVKPYSLHYLRAAGVSVPEFEFFFRTRWAESFDLSRDEAAATAYAERLGYPLVVKPACKSWGAGVYQAHDRDDLIELLPRVTRIDPMFLVQRLVTGEEYRVVVFDGAIELVYHKTAPTVEGDGIRPLREILARHFNARAAEGAELAVQDEDPRFTHYLAAQGLGLDDVVPEGRRVRVSLAAGYHSGGDLREARDAFPEAARAFCLSAARATGLRLVGLDVFVTGEAETPYWLIEVNGFPGFDGYASIGPEQHARAEALVERLLLAMQAPVA